jgi:phage shock protein A
VSLIKRIANLLKANINDILGKVEDPEKMLNQLMGDLREEQRKAHVQVVRSLADEKRLEQQVRDLQDKLEQWKKRAEVAVMRDEDELAREAIARRNEYATMVDELTRQWEEQHERAEQLKDLLSQLGRRYQEAEFRKQHLVNRHRAAKANQQATETMSRLSNTDHLEEFAKVEQKILDMGAMAEANAEITMPSLEAKFAQLESGGVVEHDLMQLKMQLGKTVPQLPGANGSGPAALPGGRSAASQNGSAPGGQAAPAPAPAHDEDPASFN